MKITAALSVASCLVALSAADGSDHPLETRMKDAVMQKDDGQRPPEFQKRKVDAFSVDDATLIYRTKSGSKDTANANGLELFFSTIGFPRWRLRTMQRIGDDKSASSFGTGFFGLAEYNDTISPQESRNRVRFLGLAPGSWSSMKSGLASSTTADGATIKSVSTTLRGSALGFNSANFPDFKFTISAKYTDAATLANGTALVPNGLKYSLLIEKFPFKYLNSRLALIQGFMHNERRMEVAGDNSSVSIGGGKGAFSWDKTLTVDGQQKQVSLFSAQFSDEAGNITLGGIGGGDGGRAPDGKDSDIGTAPKFLIFTLPKGDSILWDPTAASTDTEVLATGTAASTSDSDRMTTPLLSMVAAAFVALLA